MNVLVLSELDNARRADLAGLLLRCEEADDHPALAEPQRVAAARRDLGADGAQVVLAYDGAALIGCVFVSPAIDGATALHVAIDPSCRGGREGDGGGATIQAELLQVAIAHAHGTLRLWLMKASPADDADAVALGFVPERDLVQMRVPLPLAADVVASARPLTTRPFRPGQDDEAWLDVNNQAFADHPEQGGWTLDDLHERTSADWFDPAGFLIADSDDGSGRLLGSCWTKIHRDTVPALGEIYIISVNPTYQGGGWGRSLTVAGLQWMSAHGVTVGMLYTTASNTAAVALYRKLGFTVDHTDRSYVRTTTS